MRIVLDTNVLLSAYLFQGYTAEVFDHIWLSHQIFLSDWILDEVATKCIQKFKISQSEISKIIIHLRKGSQIINPESKIPDLCIDKDDNHILHIADFIQADLLVTGDNDLLVLKKYLKTKIISPKDYKISFMNS